MVYLDNAATTYPKPSSVIAKSSYAMINYGANPGRAGHRLSLATAEAVFGARQKCAEFFGAEVENVCFVSNCTLALNIAIKGVMSEGSHIITSDMEHNAVIRPINAAAGENSGTFSIAVTDSSDEKTVKAFERLITPKTKAIVCTVASNVTGKIMPFASLGKLCKEKGICFIVDAAQGAGVLPLNLKRDNINIICAAGHKGLYGPMGTGLLITDGKYRLKTLIEGGTGSASREIEQPEFLPDRFESGTINTPGAIALGAGVDYVRQKGVDVILNHEWTLCKYAHEALKKQPDIELYPSDYTKDYAPLFSFNIKGKGSEETALTLSNLGFCLRGGLHCAFLAHTKLGTLETGTVRFAPSIFTTKNEVTAFIRAMDKLPRN